MSAGRRLPPRGFYFCPLCERDLPLTGPCAHVRIAEDARSKLIEIAARAVSGVPMCSECGHPLELDGGNNYDRLECMNAKCGRSVICESCGGRLVESLSRDATPQCSCAREDVAELTPWMLGSLGAMRSVPMCRVCGCTDDDCSGCIARTGAPCRWIEPDLCSACMYVRRG